MKNKNRNKKQKDTKNILMILICTFIPFLIGFYNGDFLVGGTLLMSGLICSCLASMGKKSNYIFGFVNALLNAYVAYKNNLFGSFAINVFIFAPLEIYGFVSWSRNLDRDKDVKIRKFTIKEALIVTGTCVFGSIVLGYLLTLIPCQRLAFLDSITCCVDVCALVLMNLRFRESWWLWIISGLISIVIWSDTFANGGENALMRLIASFGYLIINTYAAIKYGLSKKVKLKKF